MLSSPLSRCIVRECAPILFFCETLYLATGISRNRAQAMSRNGARETFPKGVSRLSLCARQHGESPVMSLRVEIDALQIWSVSLGGGTITTRRPNNRASIENAPGPRRASAAGAQ